MPTGPSSHPQKINDKNITQLAGMDIGELASWFEDLPNHLNKKQNAIAKEIIKEIKNECLKTGVLRIDGLRARDGGIAYMQ